MCTAAAYLTKDLYFGRNLDYERSYGEHVVIVPRSFPLPMRHTESLPQHYAMIGMAHVQDGYPLFYDAMNEKGLCIAGLNFVGNAVYFEPSEDACNVAQFEFIPWLLGRCATLGEARKCLETLRLTGTPFCPGMPAAQLHWLLAGRDGCLVIEQTADGLHVYDDPAGVLTNNPPFPMQRFALNNYAALSPRAPENRFAPELPLSRYSRGMGAIGLPGDLSSQSRFVRAAFTRLNSRSGTDEASSVSQLFHILTSVEQQRGCCELEDGSCELTLYSSCCSAASGIYYYRTYDNSALTAVCLFREELDGSALIAYPLETEMRVSYAN